MKPLTKIEKRFAAINSDIVHVEDPDGIRKAMKKIAYHEAGHFVVPLFTKLDYSHTTELSILGNNQFMGYARSERNITELNLDSNPPSLKRAFGRQLLMKHLAGYGAEMILGNNKNYNSIVDYYVSEYGEFLEFEDEGDDWYRASQIAVIMKKPYMTVNRIIKLADKWTLEMLEMPGVWNVVKSVANRLIEKGTIKENGCMNLILMYDDANFPQIAKLKKWGRRLWITPQEDEKLRRKADDITEAFTGGDHDV